MARLFTLLKVKTISDNIEHEKLLQWLEERAKSLVAQTILPVCSEDKVYLLHRSFLHMAFLYYDLRHAIRWEDGPTVILH